MTEEASITHFQIRATTKQSSSSIDVTIFAQANSRTCCNIKSRAGPGDDVMHTSAAVFSMGAACLVRYIGPPTLTPLCLSECMSKRGELAWQTRLGTHVV